ncbi:MAG: alpha-2-macroglobulin, partial [Chloroflexota bacterium]|nr:alpha-2-macroglobulin [Chloroflexota bacterium]
ELTANTILSATGAHWEEKEVEPWSLGSSTRSTALALRALVRVEPEHMLLPQTVRWLMQARQHGHWETTQETAWSVLALTDYMLASSELDADFSYEVALNDDVVLSERANGDNLAESVSLEIDIAALLLDEANQLIITRVPESGEGRLYYAAWLRYFLPVETLDARNEGISVSRRYEAVDPDTLESIGESVERAEVGDAIMVRLMVEAPNDLYFFTLEDPIPAGFEILDPSLQTSAQGIHTPSQTRVDEPGPFWYDEWSRRIIRDEKVALFADRLPRGTYEYTYFLRATVPGRFNVLPAVAYEQYHPEIFGRSEGTTFSIDQ